MWEGQICQVWEDFFVVWLVFWFCFVFGAENSAQKLWLPFLQKPLTLMSVMAWSLVLSFENKDVGGCLCPA